MTHRATLLTHVIASCLCAASFAAEEPAIRFLTYNIHHGRGTDEKLDLNRIAKVILDSKADLVALQEVDRNTRRTNNVDQLQELATLTKMHAAFGKAIAFQGGEYGVGILSRYPLNHVKRHPLPTSAGHEARLAVESQVVVAGQRVTFVCTHLDHTSDAGERRRQATRLNELFSDRADGPVVLAGDLNMPFDSAEMKVLLQGWRPSALAPAAPTSPAHEPTTRIDYVLLRKRDAWRVRETRVLAERVASDHRPLLVNAYSTAAAVSVRPDRKHLLETVDQDGTKRSVQSVEEWPARNTDILNAMQQVMGQLPTDRRCALDVQIVEEVDCGRYFRRLISYASEPGSRVPAYLLVPKSALAPQATAPAALCLHPTDNEAGHKLVVGLGTRPNRQYAQELAERGYVTLSPAYPQLANYHPDLQKLGYQSGTMKAIWDNIRGIDLLMSLPFVSKRGVGAIGHSLGGHNAVYTAAFDSRISVVVTSCGLDSYVDYKDGDIRGWTSTRYMPQLLEYAHCPALIPFDFHEIIATLAPRPCLIIAPQHDDNFQWRSVDEIASAARPVYELHNAGGSLKVLHPDCGHDFPSEMRERAYQLLDSVLR